MVYKHIWIGIYTHNDIHIMMKGTLRTEDKSKGHDLLRNEGMLRPFGYSVTTSFITKEICKMNDETTKGKLQFTSCKNCDTDYLVGIDGKDIRNIEMATGVPLLSVIGNEEKDKATQLPDSVPCKKCGNICKVENAGEVE